MDQASLSGRKRRGWRLLKCSKECLLFLYLCVFLPFISSLELEKLVVMVVIVAKWRRCVCYCFEGRRDVFVLWQGDRDLVIIRWFGERVKTIPI